ncbi:MAG: hypothetical protein LBN29_11355 [Mediterranea sp.]|jgi:hypothetical protein|nr:hypothetical protein [Mediterranea sp.]
MKLPLFKVIKLCRYTRVGIEYEEYEIEFCGKRMLVATRKELEALRTLIDIAMDNGAAKNIEEEGGDCDGFFDDDEE